MCCKGSCAARQVSWPHGSRVQLACGLWEGGRENGAGVGQAHGQAGTGSGVDPCPIFKMCWPNLSSPIGLAGVYPGVRRQTSL